MRDRSISKCNPHHTTFDVISAFSNGVCHFTGLAQPKTHLSLFVPYDYEGAEAKTAAAFDYLRRSIDENDFLAQVAASLSIRGLFGCIHWSAPATAPLAAARATATAARLEITLWLIRHNSLLGSN
jgi:hypothetical protein